MEDSTIKTLAFFEIFKRPLRIEEIWHYLYGTGGSRAGFEEAVNRLIGKKIVIESNGCFALTGEIMKRDQLKNLRKIQSDINDGFRKKVKKYHFIFRLCPFIKMVAVCNSPAFGAGDKNSDIDLFIVTKEGRIFTARTMVTLLTHLFGVRRHGNKVAGRFCLSFFINDKKLNLSGIKNKKDVYLDFWTASLKPVFGMDTYHDFCKENIWVKDFFTNWEPEKSLYTGINKGDRQYAVSRLIEKILQSRLGNLLESYLRHIHQKRHHAKLSKLGDNASVVVNDSMLKYHNWDRRKEFQEKWEKRISGFCK